MRSNYYCQTGKLSSYSTYNAAEAACISSSSCLSVYDDNCDNTGTFYTCSSSTGVSSSVGSCLYLKPTPASSSWVQRRNYGCSSNAQIGSYSTYSAAEAQCISAHNCWSVVADSCSTIFYACRDSIGYSQGSCATMYLKPGRRDCQGAWSDWGPCSTTCEAGTKEKTYRVSVAGDNGARPCLRNSGNSLFSASVSDGDRLSTACNTNSPCPSPAPVGSGAIATAAHDWAVAMTIAATTMLWIQ
eukprot:COSAG01_NODE_2232_length_8117_cov_4.366426_8_plen_243_part_00